MLKKFLVLTSATLSLITINIANAQTQCRCMRGFYALANIGWAGVDYNRNLSGNLQPAGFVTGINTSSTNPGDQWGLGAGAGYQWNDYFALEAAFDYFFTQQNNNFTVIGGTGGTGSSVQKDTYAFFLFAKGTVPLQEGFILYGKLGGALEWTTLNLNISGNGFNSSASTCQGSIRPAFGLGVDYLLTRKLTAYFDWTGISGNASNTSGFFTTGPSSVSATTSVSAPTVNYVSVGLRYFFG